MALEINAEALKKRGQRAKARALARSPHERTIRPQDWYPELRVMLDDGLDKDQVSKATGLTTRRVNQILAGVDLPAALENQLLGTAKEWDALEPQHRAMMPFTAEAFELFFNAFAEYPTGLSPLHKSWVHEFCTSENLLLNVPPRHAKSTIFSVWVPIWLLARNRNEQVLLVSAGVKLAQIFCYQIELQLRLNTRLIGAFGHFAPANPKDGVWSPRSGELIVTGRSKENRTGQFSILCRGAGQHILGIEATVVICDDPTSQRVSKSDTERASREEWLREQVLSRLEPLEEGEPTGRALVIGQRVHLHDVYGVLAEDLDDDTNEPIWTHVQQPMVLAWPSEPDGSDCELLWPGRFTWKDVRTIRGRTGSTAFNTLYQQDPLPDEAAFVRAEWLEACRDPRRSVGMGSRGEDQEGDILPIVRVLSIDPSPTQWNSYVVADVVASKDSFYAQIIDLGHWKGANREMKHTIFRLLDKYSPDYFILERSAVSAWLQAETWYEEISHRARVLGHFTGKNKWDPEMGLLSLAADFEGGRISYPWKDDEARQASGLLEAEAARYGHGFPDDILMALWFIKVNFRKLRPLGTTKSHFNRGGNAWGYIKREAKRQPTDKDRQIREWEKAHGIRRRAKV